MRQHSPYPLGRRLVRGLWRLLGDRPQKGAHSTIVEIGPTHFKRVVLGDAASARELEARLERFANRGLFPALVTRYENELWLEFVQGAMPRADDPQTVEGVADFYAALYADGGRRVALAQTAVPRRLARQLEFLRDVEAIGSAVYGDLERASERDAPGEVWVGDDYDDPVLKNFVRRPGQRDLCAVDVEALRGGELLGTGLARALARWAEPHRQELLARVKHADVATFEPYFDYLELAFAASYTTNMVLEGKWKYVEPARFERFRARRQ